MPHAEVSEVIAASSEAVFDLVHDYARRLEWDTLLSAAFLDDGHRVAAKGATSVCVGRTALFKIAVKTVYVSFDRPRVAAVKMINTPPLFETWAASIRHEDLGAGRSRIIYKLNFTAKPRLLSMVLDPLLRWVFVWETKKRLRALAAHFAAVRS